MIGGRKQLTMGGAPPDKTSLGCSWISISTATSSHKSNKKLVRVCISMIYYYILELSQILLPDDQGKLSMSL